MEQYEEDLDHIKNQEESFIERTPNKKLERDFKRLSLEFKKIFF